MDLDQSADAGVVRQARSLNSLHYLWPGPLARPVPRPRAGPDRAAGTRRSGRRCRRAPGLRRGSAGGPDSGRCAAQGLGPHHGTGNQTFAERRGRAPGAGPDRPGGGRASPHGGRGGSRRRRPPPASTCRPRPATSVPECDGGRAAAASCRSGPAAQTAASGRSQAAAAGQGSRGRRPASAGRRSRAARGLARGTAPGGRDRVQGADLRPAFSVAQHDLQIKEVALEKKQDDQGTYRPRDAKPVNNPFVIFPLAWG
jgi:hypothetical protein